mgnify:CR=1 FL=1
MVTAHVTGGVVAPAPPLLHPKAVSNASAKTRGTSLRAIIAALLMGS